jgi:hypothetical protein
LHWQDTIPSRILGGGAAEWVNLITKLGSKEGKRKNLGVLFMERKKQSNFPAKGSFCTGSGSENSGFDLVGINSRRLFIHEG